MLFAYHPLKAITLVHYIPLNHLSTNYIYPPSVICVTKWYNNDLDEQGPEMRGLLSQVDDETGRHCVDENAYAYHKVVWTLWQEQWQDVCAHSAPVAVYTWTEVQWKEWMVDDKA